MCVRWAAPCKRAKECEWSTKSDGGEETAKKSDQTERRQSPSSRRCFTRRSNGQESVGPGRVLVLTLCLGGNGDEGKVICFTYVVGSDVRIISGRGVRIIEGDLIVATSLWLTRGTIAKSQTMIGNNQ